MAQSESAPTTVPGRSGGSREDFTLRGLLTAAWHGRWILLTCIAVGLALGIRQVKKTGDVWRAESRVYVRGQDPAMSGIEGMLGTGSRNFVNTQAAVIKSGRVLQGAIARPEVASSRVYRSAPRNKVTWLREELNVSVGRDDDVISISFLSEDLESACAIVNAVVRQYQELVDAQGSNSVEELVKLFDTRQRAIEEQLNERIEARNEFLAENQMVAIDPLKAETYEYTQLSTLKALEIEAERQLQEAEDRLEEALLLKSNPELFLQLVMNIRFGYAPYMERESPAVADVRREASIVRSDLRAAQQALENLRLDVTEEHWSIAAAEESVASLDTRLKELEQLQSELESDELVEEGRDAESEMADALKFLEQRVAAARERLEEERERIAEQEKLAIAAGEKHAQHLRLQLEIDQSLRALDSLQQNRADVDFARVGKEELTNTSVDVLDRAEPRTAKLASSATRTIAQFLALAILIGSGLTWLRTVLDQRLRSEDDLAKAVPAPLLGVLPRAAISQERGNAIQSWNTEKGIAEAARGLRTAVYFSFPSGEGSVLHLTSPQKGDGKSTVTAFLGIAMAQAGQSVLIIDADLRSPRQHKVLGMPNESGLSNCIAERTSPLELAQETPQPGLDVLTTGPIPGSPAEMLNSNRFDEILAEASAAYDRVLVDSAPILAVTDSRVIATKCAATVLVTRADKTPANAATSAYERIASVGGRLLGVVLNAVPTGVGYGYGKGYGYGYGYGSDDVPVDRTIEWDSRDSGGGRTDADAPFDRDFRRSVATGGTNGTARKRHAPKTTPVADAEPGGQDLDSAESAAENGPGRVEARPSKRRKG